MSLEKRGSYLEALHHVAGDRALQGGEGHGVFRAARTQWCPLTWRPPPWRARGAALGAAGAAGAAAAAGAGAVLGPAQQRSAVRARLYASGGP